MAEDTGLIIGQAAGRAAARVGQILGQAAIQREQAAAKVSEEEEKERKKAEEREREREAEIEKAAEDALRQVLSLQQAGEDPRVIAQIQQTALESTRAGIPIRPIETAILKTMRDKTAALRQQEETESLLQELAGSSGGEPGQIGGDQSGAPDLTAFFSERGQALEADQGEPGDISDFLIQSGYHPSEFDEPEEVRGLMPVFAEARRRRQAVEAARKGRLAGITEEEKLRVGEGRKLTDAERKKQQKISADEDAALAQLATLEQSESAEFVRTVQQIQLEKQRSTGSISPLTESELKRLRAPRTPEERAEAARLKGELEAETKKARLDRETQLDMTKPLSESDVNRRLRFLAATANRSYKRLERFESIARESRVSNIEDIRDVAGVLGFLESERGREAIEWKEGQPPPAIVQELRAALDEWQQIAAGGQGPNEAIRGLTPEEETELQQLEAQVGSGL